MLTHHQARYLSFQLSKRSNSDDSEKLGAALYDAQVDLNPHQVEAALFAFESPLSKGALLADEVGLGKTIEAGILLSQWWALGKRSLLIICPSNLRKQWQQELAEKFFLPSVILETRGFKRALEHGKRNPFEQKKIVICSFHFARNKEDYVRLKSWDLAVIDEAHRLRNVYKPSNKIGNSIRQSLESVPKILLTATPLQNSLLELYGLLSLIDDRIFGDLKSFRSQFVRLSDSGEDFEDLKRRIRPICKRNLRRQVQEYIKYTQRIPITVQFNPSDEEQALYEMVTEYLQRETLLAIPQGQRHLMTLIMRKLLASSTYAISGTLDRLAFKVKKTRDEKGEPLSGVMDDDTDTLSEYEDEFTEEGSQAGEGYTFTEQEREALSKEIAELESFRDLARSIEYNAKGEKLISALEQAFAKADEIGAPRKAIIFTESRRTQEYLYERLQASPFKDEMVLFNGSNSDERSKQIYQHWLLTYQGTERVTGNKTVDIRAAITDYFRNSAQIMIATEAAAEGINLQFCSTVVNFDLPWNPQRIEQRIGRCHRYGQKYDVVVVNFVNLRNAADQRVFQLLDQKFQLFSGVFGASDEVLGAVESGVDFERRITEIYKQCRTEAEIQNSFDQLQEELDEQITQKMQHTREKLMEHFDMEVIDKLRVTQEQSRVYLNRYQKWLWELMKYSLEQHATFNEQEASFTLHQNPWPKHKIALGRYKIASQVEDARKLRIQHPLTQLAIRELKAGQAEPAELHFDLTGFDANIEQLTPFIGESGYMHIQQLTVNSLDVSDEMIFTCFTDKDRLLDVKDCFRLLELPVTEIADWEPASKETDKIAQYATEQEAKALSAISHRNQHYFLQETEKLNKWADDKILAAEQAISDTKARIKELNRESRQAGSAESLLSIQQQLREQNRKQRRLRQQIFDVEERIEEQRDAMIAEIEQRLEQHITKTDILTIRWKLI